jgi:putative transposase
LALSVHRFELDGRDVPDWLEEPAVVEPVDPFETALIDPGKPWQNGSNESFNGKFRDECLGLQWFRNRTEAKVLIESWRREYNTVRPHSSLSNLTPAEFVARSQSTESTEAIS